MTDESGVRITLPQIYAEMVQMKDDFADVKALLEKHIALEEQRSTGVEQRLENHGTRIGEQGTQIIALDNRVGKLESERTTVEKREGRKATWPQVIMAIGGIIGGSSVLIGVLVALSKFTEVLERLN